MAKYELIVSNIGTVATPDNATQAESLYQSWVELSEQFHGRASGEDVTLLMDGEPIREHQGFLNRWIPEE